jgi:hypothetical protein
MLGRLRVMMEIQEHHVSDESRGKPHSRFEDSLESRRHINMIPQAICSHIVVLSKLIQVKAKG